MHTYFFKKWYFLSIPVVSIMLGTVAIAYYFFRWLVPFAIYDSQQESVETVTTYRGHVKVGSESRVVRGSATPVILAIGMVVIIFMVGESAMDIAEALLETNIVYMIPFSLGLCLYAHLTIKEQEAEKQSDATIGSMWFALTLFSISTLVCWGYAIAEYDGFFTILINFIAYTLALGVPFSMSCILVIDLLKSLSKKNMLRFLLPAMVILPFYAKYQYDVKSDEAYKIAREALRGFESKSRDYTFGRDDLRGINMAQGMFNGSDQSKGATFAKLMKENKVPFAIFTPTLKTHVRNDPISFEMFHLSDKGSEEVIYKKESLSAKGHDGFGVYVESNIVYAYDEYTKAKAGNYRIEFESPYYEIEPIETYLPYGVTEVNVKYGERKVMPAQFLPDEGLTKEQKNVIKYAPYYTFLAFNNLNPEVNNADVGITIDWNNKSYRSEYVYPAGYTSIDYHVHSIGYSSEMHDEVYQINFFVDGYYIEPVTVELKKGELIVVDINPVKR